MQSLQRYLRGGEGKDTELVPPPLRTWVQPSTSRQVPGVSGSSGASQVSQVYGVMGWSVGVSHPSGSLLVWLGNNSRDMVGETYPQPVDNLPCHPRTAPSVSHPSL